MLCEQGSSSSHTLRQIALFQKKLATKNPKNTIPIKQIHGHMFLVK